MPDTTRSRRPPKPTNKPSTNATSGERLQKVLAAAGVASRRQCEELILEGRVEIDRKVVTELGVRVEPGRQEIRLDGEELPTCQRVYYLVNKPPGILSTNSDPTGRSRVIDLVPDGERLFTVGRLDKSSEGLILVTNDGELANQLAHPRFGIEKVYHVTVDGHPTPGVLASLRKGVHLAEAFARPERLAVKKRLPRMTVLELVLREGRNREIRRILARVGHKVRTLKRVGLGTLRLGEMPSGAYRELNSSEVRALRKGSTPGGKSKNQRKKRPKKKSR